MVNVYIKTFGCSVNVSDSERMAGVLQKKGHSVVSSEDKADVVVINSCTVKNEAETKLYREIRKHKGKKIVVAGCVAQAETKLKDSKLKDYSIVGTSQTSKIAMVVNETLKGNRVVLLDKDQKNIDIPRIRRNEVVEIIPINEGCLGNCSYCKVKAARGNLSSYKKEDIVKLAIKAVNSGAKQLWITSQDTGAYGLDIKETLPTLLKEIINIDGDFKVRLGMCNPNFALKYLDDLIEILKSEKMFRFIHIPLQSGNDKILKLMNRKYKKQEFVKVFETLRQKVENITIATDIIVGFPTETNSEFNETLELIKQLKPDILNISRFWARQKTKAADMKQLDSKTIKDRSKELTAIFEKISFENNQKWVGWQGDAIIEEKGKQNTFTARNFAYKPIIVKNNKLGEIISVKIKSVTSWDLRT